MPSHGYKRSEERSQFAKFIDEELTRLGAELGLLSLEFDDLTDTGGALPNKNGLKISELDFGGVYFKLQGGIGF